MAHYGYADARPLLDHYPYRPFTGDNIAELSTAMDRCQVDAVILGSNALNDRDILRTVQTPEFAVCLARFLDTGRGLLCLQQLGLAMRKGPTLSFLPDPLNAIRPVVLPPNGAGLTQERLAFGSGMSSHVAMTYPHELEPESIGAHARSFQSLPGLYWHYWDQLDAAEWDNLLIDPSSVEVRTLVASSRESSQRRVVVSSLPLDWQGHREAFGNLLIYAAEGRHSIATVFEGGADETMEYLEENLTTRRIPFGRYAIPDDAPRLAQKIRQGVHSTVIVAPRLSLDDLPAVVTAELGPAVKRGALRVLDLQAGAFDTRAVKIISRERQPRQLLQQTELQMHVEMRGGYIDDSFWSHVEALQGLEQLSERTANYEPLLEPAWQITRNHDRHGSYDEIFGPTCAYYWFRARFRGVSSPEAQETAAWLRRVLHKYYPHERALAYVTFASFDQLLPTEVADLEKILTELQPASLSENELVLYLRAAFTLGSRTDVLPALTTALINRSGKDGIWLDLATTAAIASVLQDAGDALDRTEDLAEIRADIEQSVLAAIVYILRRLALSEASPGEYSYPWEGKASTTIKCLQAWLKFDTRQDLPLYEMLGILDQANITARRSAARADALSVLRDLTGSNNDLRKELHATSSQRDEAIEKREEAAGTVKSVLRQLKWRNTMLAVAATLLYVAVTLLVGALKESSGNFAVAARAGFIDAWAFHLTLIGVVLGTLGFVSQRDKNRSEQ